jgi:hypothetical protein
MGNYVDATGSGLYIPRYADAVEEPCDGWRDPGPINDSWPVRRPAWVPIWGTNSQISPEKRPSRHRLPIVGHPEVDPHRFREHHSNFALSTNRST